MHEVTSIHEIKNMLVEILESVALFCDNNSLRYYLAFGTLLGAIRHNGFIPWDDDVDIMMPRSDYDIFVKTFHSELYEIKEVRNNRDYFYPFAKVYDNRTIIIENRIGRASFGLYIDVFPIDGIDISNTMNMKRSVALQKLLKNKYSPFDRPRSLVKQLLLPFWKAFLLPINSRSIGLAINKHSSRYSYDKCEKVGILCWGYYFQVYDKNDIEPGVLHLFEGKLFSIPHCSHNLLKTIYGDYLELPPIENRVSKHEYQVFLK